MIYVYRYRQYSFSELLVHEKLLCSSTFNLPAHYNCLSGICHGFDIPQCFLLRYYNTPFRSDDINLTFFLCFCVSGVGDWPVCVHAYVSWIWEKPCRKTFPQNWQCCVLASKENREGGKVDWAVLHFTTLGPFLLLERISRLCHLNC